MDPEWRKTLSEMGMTDDTKHPKDEFEPLKSKLLSIGGEAVVVYKEPDLESILSRGELFTGEGVPTRKGNNCRCHENAAENFVDFGDGIATGFALSIDGAWRPHSWNIDQVKGTVIETTEPRVAYFGFVLNDDEAKVFADENPPTPVVRSVLDPDRDDREYLLHHVLGQSIIENRIDGPFVMLHREVLPGGVCGSRVWVVAQESHKVMLLGTAVIEDFETNDDDEYKTKLTAYDEYTVFGTPIEIRDQEIYDGVKALGDSAGSIEMADGCDAVRHLLSLARSSEITDW